MIKDNIIKLKPTNNIISVTLLRSLLKNNHFAICLASTTHIIPIAKQIKHIKLIILLLNILYIYYIYIILIMSFFQLLSSN